MHIQRKCLQAVILAYNCQVLSIIELVSFDHSKYSYGNEDSCNDIQDNVDEGNDEKSGNGDNYKGSYGNGYGSCGDSDNGNNMMATMTMAFITAVAIEMI